MMKEALVDMEGWYNKKAAQLLLKAEKQQLDGILSCLFGYYLVQLGGPACFDLLSKSPIRCRIRVGSEGNTCFSGITVCSEFEALPFANNSIDVMLLFHVLEFSSFPGLILQEMKRVLIPEGCGIIFSFNSFSLWGLARIIGSRHTPPCHGQFHSLFAIRQLLHKNELMVIDNRSLFFRPPLESSRLQDKLLFLEAMGQLCWSACGAVNMVTVKKRLQTLTPVRLYGYTEELDPLGQAVKPTNSTPSSLRKISN